jgi:NAD(P)-dependent dehydrogenase (short-subunit alcohol dehydrogenase family)
METPQWGLDKKVSLVTGAGRGLGRQVALKLTSAGSRVAIASRTRAEIEETAAEIRARGGEVLAVSADVSNPGKVKDLFARVLDHYGTIDVLVNNAAVNIRKPCLDLTFEDWEKVIGINLTGYFLCAQAAGRVMVPNRSGKIVNIGSEIGVVGSSTGQAAYASSKGGIIQLTRCLAVEWAPYRINVNCVAPTVMRTPLIEEKLKDSSYVETLLKKIPLGRIADADEVADVVLFLSSRLADFITGHVLMVDGGYTIV